MMEETDAVRGPVAAAATVEPREDVPDALRHPERPVSAGFQVLLGVANVSFWMASFPVFQILVPAQATAFAGDTETNVAIVLTVSAVVGLFATPLAGALSDRTTSRMGRRRPWILGGMMGLVVSLAIMASAPNVLVLAAGWGLASGSINAIFAALTAVIPDRVPVRQRGVTAGLVGLSQPLAIALGAILVGTLIQGTRTGYYAVAAIMVVGLGAFLLAYREPRLPVGAMPAFDLGGFLKSFWIDPRQHPDFGYAWLARFFVIFGWALGTGSFLYLYLQDAIGYEQLFPGSRVSEGVATVQIISTAVLVPSAVIFGFLSDRTGRRKVFVIGASTVIACGLLLLGLFPSWGTSVVAAGIIGFGFGAFLGTDIALITEVLPSAESRGKDLGIINMANVLPGVVAPTIGALVINAFATGSTAGYAALFLVSATATLVGAALILPIKSVR